MFRKFFLIFWSIVIALEFLISPNIVKAEKQYQTIPGSACEFQPPAASRAPTMESIRIDYMILGNRNISKDLSFNGLHRWKDNEWPGVDYLVPTTVPFRNGGTVDIAGWDDVGGGHSLFIRGEGPCEGWYVFVGHLNYDPGTRFTRGQHIGPDEVIGVPGCSGFENDCVDKGLKIQPHNHYTLGYTQNIFNFTDGTTPAFVKDHYWIHPSRVEGNATPSNNQTAPTLSSDQLALDFSEEGFIDQTNGPTIQMPRGWTTPKRLPFRIPLWAYPVMLLSLGVLFTRHYKPIGVAGIVITTIFLLGFYYITPVSAEPAPQTTIVLEDDFTFDTSMPEFSNQTPPPTEIVMSEEGKPSKNPADYPLNVSTPCEVSPKFDQQVLRWCGLITYYAKANGLDPNFVAAVITQESGGNPEACNSSGHFEVGGIKMCGSSAGAMGLMQVMAQDGLSGKKYGKTFWDRPTSLELLDANINIMWGTKLLRQYGATTNTSNMRSSLVSYGGDYSGDPWYNRYYYADIVMGIYYAKR